jgi:hypothetical protein
MDLPTVLRGADRQATVVSTSHGSLSKGLVQACAAPEQEKQLDFDALAVVQVCIASYNIRVCLHVLLQTIHLSSISQMVD